MKKKTYTQPHVNVAKIEMENPIAYSNTATVEEEETNLNAVPFNFNFNGGNGKTTEGTHHGQTLGAKESTFDFNDD